MNGQNRHPSLPNNDAWSLQFPLLQGVGSRLAASGDTPLEDACQWLTEAMADWASIDLVACDGRLTRCAAAVKGEPVAADAPILSHQYAPLSLYPLREPAFLTSPHAEAKWFVHPQSRVNRPSRGQLAVVAPLQIAGRNLGLLSFGWAQTPPAHLTDPAFVVELARVFSFYAETKRLAEEAVRIRSMRDEMLSVVSHDLKNPLTAMLVSASLLEEKALRMGDDQGGRFRKLSSSIRRSAERMNWMLSDVLDILRIEAGRLNLERGPQPLHLLIDEAAKSIASAAEQRNVTLDFQIAALEHATIQADRERLLRALANLFSCAVQATPSGGKVKARLFPDGAAVVLEVIDGGMPSDEAAGSSIFAPLWRNSDAPRGAAGLTLTATKGVIEHHGGKLELIPQKSGNCLRCVLPVEQEAVPV